VTGRALTLQPLGARGRPPPVGRALGIVGGAAALGLFAMATAVVLSRNPLPSTVVAAFGIALLGTLALALRSYDGAVALGLVLTAFVWFEPSPPDLVFGVVIAVALVTGRFTLGRIPLAVSTLLGAFLALNLFASVDVVDANRAAFFFAITLYLAIFALWFGAYVDSTPRARLVVKAYVTAAVLSAVLATLALYVQFPGHNALVLGPRAKGLFKDPNVYGAFLVPAALIVLEEIVRPRLLRLRTPAKLALVSALTVGILFSFSRAAWLNASVGLIVMLGVLALRRGGGRRALAVVAVVLTATAVVFVTVAVTSSVSFIDQRAHFQSYDVQRFGAQLSGIEYAVQYPLGIGPGQFELLSPVSAHSTYVRALAEEGLLGLLLLLSLMVLTLFLAVRNAEAGRDTYGIGSAALLAAWCGLLANSVFVDTLHSRHLWLVAALIWAAAARPSWGRR
jgi:hypothetical protein